MIIDLLSHASHSHALGARYAAGLKWLAEFRPQITDGRYAIDGDDVYALVQSYHTAAAAGKKYESHRLYADIQYIATGTETIFYAPTVQLTPVTAYDAQKDYLLYADPVVSTPLAMSAGTFAIFLPHDGHKPGCIAGTPSPVKKVVIKIRV